MPRVARAQKIIRLHHLLYSASTESVHVALHSSLSTPLIMRFGLPIDVFPDP